MTNNTKQPNCTVTQHTPTPEQQAAIEKMQADYDALLAQTLRLATDCLPPLPSMAPKDARPPLLNSQARAVIGGVVAVLLEELAQRDAWIHRLTSLVREESKLAKAGLDLLRREFTEGKVTP